ncbi:MAG TPA: NAD-dependent epimerase/dehydratase family protein [Actinomycetota bacterium]|nr:NAD-dependent epimerase/dehydratase family protein [Actinomycetota bacterium]
MTKTATVAGAGGFIGHHLVKYLKAEGYTVRGVDIKEPEYEATDADEFLVADLREYEACQKATTDVEEVYQLAADMGGIGYITENHADVARNNVLINAHMLEAAHRNGAGRYFYSSSACIYPMYKQHEPDVTPLREDDAYPADPEEGYGWEKLYAEKLCQYYTEEGKLETRVARFHNIYGPLGTYEGGREKAPAAISRKVALAADGDQIEIWGDGQQTRSFTYVDDCVDGIYRLMHSEHHAPLNLGTDRLITVDGLVDLVADVAGKTLVKVHDTSKPQGVRGRNSDNTKLREVLGWEPPTTLEDGMRETYRWIESELTKAGRVGSRREAV